MNNVSERIVLYTHDATFVVVVGADDDVIRTKGRFFSHFSRAPSHMYSSTRVSVDFCLMMIAMRKV